MSNIELFMPSAMSSHELNNIQRIILHLTYINSLYSPSWSIMSKMKNFTGNVKAAYLHGVSVYTIASQSPYSSSTARVGHATSWKKSHHVSMSA